MDDVSGLGLCPAYADDATQEVFVILSQKLDRVPPDRIRSFAYGTALRVASHARRVSPNRIRTIRWWTERASSRLGSPRLLVGSRKGRSHEP